MTRSTPLTCAGQKWPSTQLVSFRTRVERGEDAEVDVEVDVDVGVGGDATGGPFGLVVSVPPLAVAAAIAY